MSTVANATTDAATLPPFITEAPRRTRRSHRRVPMDDEPIVTQLDDGSLMVSLFGGRADGRSMRIDAAVWADVSRRFSKRWVVNYVKGWEYIRSGRRTVGTVAGQPGECPTATLARIILDARPGERVVYANGDHLDVRRAALALEYPRHTRAGSRAHG